jgi:uncharacterized protein YigA (DUF484 family)
MATVVDLRDHAVASLRARVAEIEEANRDLVAFARGHSGAVAAIHAAVLAAQEAEGLDHLIHVVTQNWPDILGLDAVAIALVADNCGMRADMEGLQFVDPVFVERALEGFGSVVLRNVGRGHPLFGPASDLVRAEAMIRLEACAPLPTGILALGQRKPQGFDNRHGSELLIFLGAMLSRMLGRWLLP